MNGNCFRNYLLGLRNITPKVGVQFCREIKSITREWDQQVILARFLPSWALFDRNYFRNDHLSLQNMAPNRSNSLFSFVEGKRPINRNWSWFVSSCSIFMFLGSIWRYLLQEQPHEFTKHGARPFGFTMINSEIFGCKSSVYAAVFMLHRTSYHYLTRWISCTVHRNSIDAVVSFVNTFTRKNIKTYPRTSSFKSHFPWLVGISRDYVFCLHMIN